MRFSAAGRAFSTRAATAWMLRFARATRKSMTAAARSDAPNSVTEIARPYSGNTNSMSASDSNRNMLMHGRASHAAANQINACLLSERNRFSSRKVAAIYPVAPMQFPLQLI